MQTIQEALQEQSFLKGLNMENSEFYSGVELSEEEVQAAMNAARRLKYNQLEDQQRIAQQQAREREIMRPWDHRELYDYIHHRSEVEYKTPLIVDSDNEYVIKALCYYFTGNVQFEKMGDGWSLNKGICLQGSVGLGKSHLMTLFSRNKRACFGVISARKVASLFAEIGHEILYQYSNIRKEPAGDARIFYQREVGTCFDDLGTESVKKNWGNQSNVMEEVLLNRYDRKYEFGLHYNHITTNLNVDEITECYGTRVRSRFKEMFNQVVLTGKDRRK